ncbi:MAG: hypothetical protein KAY06_05160, partial [Aeromonadaceae bacterium]|nr:hypothetical protein [Aeromonadaceae bacterium]
GLWISGLRILFPENQGRLPRKDAMNHKKALSTPEENSGISIRPGNRVMVRHYANSMSKQT